MSQPGQSTLSSAVAPQAKGPTATPPTSPDGAPHGWAAARDAIQIGAMSAILWMVYVPHYVVLRLLGPRIGMAWVSLAANVHWLLSFLGAQRPARQSLTNMHPYFDTSLSVSQILRRHLLLKHECFARARVWNSFTNDGRQSDLRWRIDPDCVDALPSPQQRARGLIVVGYHFNFFLLSPAALKQILPGAEVVQLRYRSWRCVENAATPIARLAMKKAMEADRRAGAKVYFIDENTIVELFRLLRKGGVVAVTADGGAAAEFVDVPFFDGTLRVPSAWAKIAAGAKSDVLLVCDTEHDRHTRDGHFFNHIRCTGTSQDAAYVAVAESIRILEQMIRREPWGWHPWQRLQVEVEADGARRYYLKQFGFDSSERLAKKPSPDEVRPQTTLAGTNFRSATEHGDKSQQSAEVRRKPRVAVISNSRPPYRIHLHKRIVEELPEIELWSLATHDNAYRRWSGLTTPAELHPVEFGPGQPTNEQTKLRFCWREWRKGGQIIRWLRERQVDAVLCQGCGDFGRMRIIHWCREQGIPCFITGDFNICTDNHGRLKRWMKRQAYERAVNWCTGLMPCGELGLKLLQRYGGNQKPAFMFPFTADVELFEETPKAIIDRVTQRYSLSPERRRIVFSARMMNVKRPDLAVNAFIAIADARPEWDLVMLGDGPLRSRLEQSVPARLRDRILWTGFLDNPADVAGFYAVSDLLLLPSDYEPWGVVVVEAAAAGLAIVASDVVGASPELIKHGRNGSLFRAGDVASLTQELLAITEPDRIDEARQESKIVVSQWMETNDPVDGLRAALVQSHVLPEVSGEPSSDSGEHHWIGTAGGSVAPV